MDTLFSLLALAMMGYGAYVVVRWMMRAGQIHSRKAPPLSPRDLQVLEETADRLMVEMKAVADECVERIERAAALAQFGDDRKQSTLRLENSVSRFGDTDCPAVKVARDAGITTGEVELIRGLQAIAAQRE